MSTDQRPVFLELWRIRLPITGWVSILHRISGVLLVLLLPYGVYLLDLSLRDPQGFATAQAILGSGPARFALLLLAWSLAHHLLAGLRFLLLDLGIGVERLAARRSAGIAIAAGLALTLIAGGLLL